MLYTVLTMTVEMSNHNLAVYTCYLELTGLISERLHLVQLCNMFKVVASTHLLVLQSKK